MSYICDKTLLYININRMSFNTVHVHVIAKPNYSAIMNEHMHLHLSINEILVSH